jgi:hypothetical protein
MEKHLLLGKMRIDQKKPGGVSPMSIPNLLIDKEDEHLLAEHAWHLREDGYVYRFGKLKSGKFKTIYLHRIINNTPKGSYTDHKNHNKLDNRRSNLRTVTNSQNMLHYARKSNQGAFWEKRRKHWYCQIRVNNKKIYLGSLKTKEEALLAHHKKVSEVISE